MLSKKQNFFSIVLVGRPNPQILNHDFLVRNGILPDEPPFTQDEQEEETPFTKFFSTPPVAQIEYGDYALLVQEDRYQAIDSSGNVPTASPIIDITKRYFGDVLKYTPFARGGLNLNCDLSFEDQEDILMLDEAIGIDRPKASSAFDAENPILSTTANFPFLKGRLSVAISKPKDTEKPVKAHFNYEFDFHVDMSLKSFLASLDSIDRVSEYCFSFFKRIGVSI